jgi:hypothetical protein
VGICPTFNYIYLLFCPSLCVLNVFQPDHPGFKCKSQDVMLSDLLDFSSFCPYTGSGGYWNFSTAEHESFGFLRRYIESGVFCPFDDSIRCFLYSYCGYSLVFMCVLCTSHLRSKTMTRNTHLAILRIGPQKSKFGL